MAAWANVNGCGTAPNSTVHAVTPFDGGGRVLACHECVHAQDVTPVLHAILCTPSMALTMRLEFWGPFLESLNGKCQSFPGERSRTLQRHRIILNSKVLAHGYIKLTEGSLHRRFAGCDTGRVVWCLFDGYHGDCRARSLRRFVLPLTHFIPDSRTYSVPLFLPYDPPACGFVYLEKP
jgi:hypothetical protein